MEITIESSTVSNKYLYAFQKQTNKSVLKTQTTTPIIKDGLQTAFSAMIHRWGDDNLFPNNIYQAAKDNTIIPSTLETKMQLLVSGGWTYGIPEFDENGEEVLKFVKNQALEDFLRKKINVTKYLQEAALDLYWHYIAFPQIVIDRETDKIVNIAVQDAQHCRFSKQDQNGNIPFSFVNANWDKFEGENSDYCSVFQNIDTYNDPVADLRQYKTETVKVGDAKTANNSHYIYPISLTSSGTIMYPYAAWIAALKSKWVALANSIASYKNSLMENELTASYLIYIDEAYWTTSDPNWRNMNAEQQKEKKEKLKTIINNLISGAENAGKTLTIPTMLDKVTKTQTKYLTIEPVAKLIRDNAYIEDSQEASSHLLYALGVPSALIGNTPGKGGMGAGSGSDVDKHFQLYSWKTRTHEETLLEPFNRLILPYNGWGEYKLALRKPKFDTNSQKNTDQRM